MTTLHPQFIKDTNGKKSLVVLPLKEFEEIVEQLVELENIRLYDEAKSEDTGERIQFSNYLNSRKKRDA